MFLAIRGKRQFEIPLSQQFSAQNLTRDSPANARADDVSIQIGTLAGAANRLAGMEGMYKSQKPD